MRLKTAACMLPALFLIAAAAESGVLPRGVIVSVSAVQTYFPQVTREEHSGSNATAVGAPTATRSVIFANGDASKKVTLSVDRYASGRDASAAYRSAIAKSRIPGSAPITVPVLGQATFAGRVTRGSETHVGMGILDGNLIVGATLAGYSANDANLHKLWALARLEATAAREAAR